jgi:putative spermidine/putrescine transport system substrate-binding protein
MEYVYSDEGQLGFLKGYCHPARFNSLVAAGKVPQEMLDKLPPAELYAKAVFPSLPDQTAMTQVITGQWDSVVGANVQ